MINEIHITEEGRVTVVVQEEATEILVTDLPGRSGTDGISAYQVAVNNGYTGTEAEWLDDLIIDSGEFADGVWSLLLPGTGMALDRDPITKVITIRGTDGIPFDNTDSGLLAQTLASAINELAHRTRPIAQIGEAPTLVATRDTVGYHSDAVEIPPHAAGDALLVISGSRNRITSTPGWYQLWDDTSDPDYGTDSSAHWQIGAGSATPTTVLMSAPYTDHYANQVLALRGDDIQLSLVEHLQGSTTAALTDTDNASAFLIVATSGENGAFPVMPLGVTALGPGMNQWYMHLSVCVALPNEDRSLPSFTFTNAEQISVIKVVTSPGPSTEERVALVEGRVSTLEEATGPTLLLEGNQTEVDVPPGTPAGTLIFRKG